MKTREASVVAADLVAGADREHGRSDESTYLSVEPGFALILMFLK